MNQTCKVCGEPAAGFHFGAFTCEGCKSFFGRSYNNLSSISECKNNGKCIIDKKNRTTCKACRLRKCYTVGMSKGGSRYGRRSNWFKIHCLLQEQQQQALDAAGKMATATGNLGTAQSGFGDMVSAAAAAAAAQQKMHHQQQHQHNPHLMQHMNGLLGYPSYLPDMAGTPFLSASAACHPTESNAAAALPFFNIMNMNSAPTTFQLPPQVLFPSYHPAVAAAADAAYRSEMYKHRQSVDSPGSAASAESQCYTPSSARVCSRASNEEYTSTSTSIPAASQSPDLCVADEEDDQHSVSSQKSHPVAASSTVSHTIYNPVAIRLATALPSIPIAPATTTPPVPVVDTKSSASSKGSVSVALKMESLSPVSLATSRESTTDFTVARNQDCPMDLSMKTLRHSVHSFVSTVCEVSDVCSDSSRSEELELPPDSRRKFYQISGGDETESDLSLSLDNEIAKRQKTSIDEASFRGHSFATGHNANTMRGIFVCV